VVSIFAVAFGVLSGTLLTSGWGRGATGARGESRSLDGRREDRRRRQAM
jgi:hypothetical protein